MEEAEQPHGITGVLETPQGKSLPFTPLSGESVGTGNHHKGFQGCEHEAMDFYRLEMRGLGPICQHVPFPMNL